MCLLSTTFDMDDTQTSEQLPDSVDPISQKEVKLAIKQLKNGKSAGVDGTQLELRKYLDSAVPHLTDLCKMVWQQERVPADWKNGIIIPLPKKATYLFVATGEVSCYCLYRARCLPGYF